jgi:archaellum biogenesis protein FlaJ (TadC family)
MAEITQWIEGHQALVQQIGSLSLIVLAVTVVALPVVVIKLPQDYFTVEKREPASQTRKQPLLWAVLSLLKNLLGILLILVGLAMLVLPGQGTVTILIGLALTNFPGKYAVEQRIVRQPAVGKTLNRIRELGGAPPLSLPSEAE